jgi:hypothetical protein
MTAARRLRDLCTAYLVAETASSARRAETDAALDAAILGVRELGDYGGLPCSAFIVRAVLYLVMEWRRASAELRAGRLGGAVSASVSMTLSYLDGTIEAPWPARPPSTGLSRGMGRED